MDAGCEISQHAGITTPFHTQTLSHDTLLSPYPRIRTRLFLGEAHKFVLFPNGCSMKQMTNLLGLYGGCDSDELRRIRKLPSRWVALCTTFPSLVIYEGGCYLLHSEPPQPTVEKKRTSGLSENTKPGKKRARLDEKSEEDEDADGPGY